MTDPEEFAPPWGVIPVTAGASKAEATGVSARTRHKIIRYERISLPQTADIIPPFPGYCSEALPGDYYFVITILQTALCIFVSARKILQLPKHS
jgi:hypothetical protein